MGFMIQVNKNKQIDYKATKKNGFNSDELRTIGPALNLALKLTQFNGKIRIYRGRPNPNYTEETPAAEISWFPNPFIPKIVIAPEVFAESDTYNNLGITLTHELIHARQGVWRIFWESLVWYITGQNGYPKFEEEAYDSVNIWWDNQKLF
jgi:hypothetical protein